MRVMVSCRAGADPPGRKLGFGHAVGRTTGYPRPCGSPPFPSCSGAPGVARAHRQPSAFSTNECLYASTSLPVAVSAARRATRIPACVRGGWPPVHLGIGSSLHRAVASTETRGRTSVYASGTRRPSWWTSTLMSRVAPACSSRSFVSASSSPTTDVTRASASTLPDASRSSASAKSRLL
jgi:hypothetical protein